MFMHNRKRRTSSSSTEAARVGVRDNIHAGRHLVVVVLVFALKTVPVSAPSNIRTGPPDVCVSLWQTKPGQPSSRVQLCSSRTTIRIRTWIPQWFLHIQPEWEQTLLLAVTKSQRGAVMSCRAFVDPPGDRRTYANDFACGNHFNSLLGCSWRYIHETKATAGFQPSGYTTALL